MDKTTATAVITCKNCGDSYTRSTTIKDKENQKPSCTNNGEIVLTASVVVNGKTYTDEYTVNVPAGHTISYEYADVTFDNQGEVTNVTPKTLGSSTYHRKVCSSCGLRLSDWERHTFNEFVNSKENPSKFVAKCECNTQYYNKTYELYEALSNAGSEEWPVSVVRVAYEYPKLTNSYTLNVPKNVTLIVDVPFELDDGASLVIEVAEGGHVEGTLGENVIVVGAGDEEYKATVSSATALKAAIEAATPVTVDGEQVGRSVSITLNEPEDEEEISLSNSIELPAKADITIDLNGNTLKSSATNDNYTDKDNYMGAAGCLVVGKDSKLSLKNGKLVGTENSNTKNNIIVNGGELNLDNMKMEFATGYGIGAFNKGTVNVNGGSIKSKNAAVHTNNMESDGTHINLDGVKLESTNNSALYLAAKATVKVTNCTLTGKNGIELAGGTLEVSNTTINYSVALTNPESSKLTAGTGSGTTNVAGALFIKLITPYIANDEKVTVSLNNVTTNYTGANSEEKIRHFGIYTDKDHNLDKNLSATGFAYSDSEVTYQYVNKAS